MKQEMYKGKLILSFPAFFLASLYGQSFAEELMDK